LIEELVDFGMAINNDAVCMSGDQSEVDEFLLKGCSLSKGLLTDSREKDNFLNYFKDNCKGKSLCNIPLIEADLKLTWSQSCQTIHFDERMKASKYFNSGGTFGANYDKLTTEPVVIAKAICMAETIKHGDNIEVFKDDFGILVVVIDFLVVISIIVYIYILDAR